MVKLNLGGGLQKIPGYVNIDKKLGSEVYPLDYEDGTVDEIRASHILEHFSHREAHEVLAHWVAKLKVGGTIQIAVPSLEWIFEHKEHPQAESYLMGGQSDENDYHKSVWTRRKLADVMAYVGLGDIQEWDSQIADCASLPVSLNLQGTKTAEKPARRVDVNLGKVVAVMSIPRLGWNDAWGGIIEATRNSEFSIPIYRFSGAFWAQCIQRALHEAQKHGADWVLTLDYDSIISAKDVRELMILAAEYPEADALVPVQVKRGSAGSFMFTSSDEDGQLRREYKMDDLSKEILPIDTGHFGCTLLRVAGLSKMAPPWFVDEPDADGHWGDDRVDADIYFWRKWRAAGNSVFQANHVKIGHLQVMISWPSNDWQILHRHVDEWTRNGKPEECRGDYEDSNHTSVGIVQG